MSDERPEPRTGSDGSPDATAPPPPQPEEPPADAAPVAPGELPERLHRAAIVLLAVRFLRGAAVPLVGIAAVALLGGGFDGGSVARIAGFTAVGAVLAALNGVIDWQTTRFGIDDAALHVRSGLFNRRETSVPLGRIQSVDLAQGPLERALGVVALEVQTAGGSGGTPEVRLAALAPDDAAALQARLRRETGPGAAEAPAGPCRRLSRAALVVVALTAPQFGVVLPALAVATQVFDDVLPRVVDLDAAPSVTDAVRALGALLAGAWALSMLAAVVAFAGFELRREGDRLRIRRGLLARRVVTVPASRIQAVVVVEGLVRQPFGLAAVRIAVAGYADQPAAAQVLFPLLPARAVRGLLGEFVPELELPAGALERPPARARRRYLATPTFMAAAAGVAGALLLSPFALLAIPAGAGLGLARWRAAGLCLEGDRIAIRERRLARRTTYALRRGVQWRSSIRTPLQERAGLARLVLVTARGTRAVVAHLDAARAGAVLAALGP